jgi:hypothetical protein
MITPDKLKEMISYHAPTLTKLAKDGGWKGPAFSSCKFLGITNGGQFCYMAVFLCEGGTDSTKIFLTHKGGRVFADIQLTEWA